MPKLKKTKVEKIILPSFESEPESDRAWVELETPAHMTDFEDVDQNQPQVRQTATMLCNKIKSWNLTDDSDQPLPINPDNVLALDAIDFGYLVMRLGLNKLQQLSQEKKTS